MAIHKIDGVDGDANFPKKFVTLYASAACTKGYFVAITTDTTNGLGASVANATAGLVTDAANALTFGVATETVAAGGIVTVQTAGKYENAYVNGSTAIGSALTGPLNSSGTTGQADLAAEAKFGPVVAVALEADATNLADVMIIDQGYF